MSRTEHVKKKSRAQVRMTRHHWGYAAAAVVLFVAGFEWFEASPKVSNSPAAHDELIAAARMMRQKPFTPTPVDTLAMIQLGKRFFFDARFSVSQTVACATCHDPQKSFTDGKRVAAGVGETAMNTPTLIDVRNGHWFFHNGRADSLEMQAMGPMENPREHGFSRGKVIGVIDKYYRNDYEALFGKLPFLTLTPTGLPAAEQVFVSDAVAAYALGTLGSSEYLKSILGRAHSRDVQPVVILKEDTAGPAAPRGDFDEAAPEIQKDINQVFANMATAIAAFERTIRTEDSAFDRFADRFLANGRAEDSYVDGFGTSEWNGFKLFVGEGRCALCHQGPDFTDRQFHNIGLPALDSKAIDLGRAQGILLAKNNLFFCEGSFFKNLNSQSEACAESQFAETENSELIGAFKTPTLRNLRDTAPYGHDGRFPKLRDILIHYNVLTGKPAVGHREESLRPLGLSEPQLVDLEAFLLSLYGTVVTE